MAASKSASARPVAHLAVGAGAGCQSNPDDGVVDGAALDSEGQIIHSRLVLLKMIMRLGAADMDDGSCLAEQLARFERRVQMFDGGGKLSLVQRSRA